MYTNAQYCNDLLGKRAGIRCEINNRPSFVPLDLSNTDYQCIMALVAAGELTIAPAEVRE